VVLAAESSATLFYRTDRRCRISAGEWLAPYTGAVVTNPSKLDVDHMGALGNAHLSGGGQWSAGRREQYANNLDDTQHLIAVTASANRSYWCQYAVDLIAIKDDWGLAVT